MNNEVFAVDFDGTLCENAWPEIGEPRWDVINWIKDLREAGHKIILWSCREDDALDAALTWCAERNIFFDAVNDNLEEHKIKFGDNCRKIFADHYIDDKALCPEALCRMCGAEEDEYNPTEMWQ